MKPTSASTASRPSAARIRSRRVEGTRVGYWRLGTLPEGLRYNRDPRGVARRDGGKLGASGQRGEARNRGGLPRGPAAAQVDRLPGADDRPAVGGPVLAAPRAVVRGVCGGAAE